jgi:imidazolonepropionase-like amidohydrolase
VIAGVHGEQFGEGPATVLLDQEKIVGVETGHVELDESWQVAEYPTATVLPGLIDTHVHLVADSEVGAPWIASPDSAAMSWTRSSLRDCGVSWWPG